jgi:hypothetical protein
MKIVSLAVLIATFLTVRSYSHHRRFGRRGLKGFTGLLMFALGSVAGLVALTIRPAHAQLSLDNVPVAYLILEAHTCDQRDAGSDSPLRIRLSSSTPYGQII